MSVTDTLHVPLDMVVSQDPDASEEANDLAAETAAQQFRPAGAIEVTFEDNGSVNVDIAPLVTDSFKVINSLLHLVTVNTGLDRDTVLALVRENLDPPDSTL